jgi:hypothetical protein
MKNTIKKSTDPVIKKSTDPVILLQKTIAQIQKLNITIPKSYTNNIQSYTTDEYIEKLQDLMIRKTSKAKKQIAKKKKAIANMEQ